MGQRLKPAGRDISRPCTRSWARLNLDAADEAAGGDVEDRQFLTVRAGKAEQDAVAFDVGAFEALARGGHGRAIRRARAIPAAGAQERAGDQRAHRHHAKRAEKDDEGERAAIAWGRCGSLADPDQSLTPLPPVS